METTLRTSHKVSGMLRSFTFKRGMVWGTIILAALVAFEIFNYSTTEFALGDVLGDLRFVGLRWSTILALAFCGIDFAGIARLFTPEKGRNEPAEVWYLFGAWLLAAAMNAMLTWWGVSVAIANRASASLSAGLIMSSTTLTSVVPVFVAIMVWLIRVLIIGSFSVAGEKLFSHEDANPRAHVLPQQPAFNNSDNVHVRQGPLTNPFRPVPKAARANTSYRRQDPSYNNVALSARPARDTEYVETPRNA